MSKHRVDSPIEQVRDAEETPVEVGTRLDNSSVPEVREVQQIMNHLTEVLDTALKFSMSDDATPEQRTDVSLTFEMLISYFAEVDNMLTTIALGALLDDLLPDDDRSE